MLQRRNFRFSTYERSETRRDGSLKAALDTARFERRVQLDGSRDALESGCPQAPANEEPLDQSICGGTYDNSARIGDTLYPCRNIGGFTRYRDSLRVGAVTSGPTTARPV